MTPKRRAERDLLDDLESLLAGMLDRCGDLRALEEDYLETMVDAKDQVLWHLDELARSEQLQGLEPALHNRGQRVTDAIGGFVEFSNGLNEHGAAQHIIDRILMGEHLRSVLSDSRMWVNTVLRQATSSGSTIPARHSGSRAVTMRVDHTARSA